MEKLDKLKEILIESEVLEVHTSKATMPSRLPAGVVSLNFMKGTQKLNPGYLNQKYTFDIHVVVRTSDYAIDELLNLVGEIARRVQAEFFTDFDKVEFYESLLRNEDITVAKFEVTI